MLASASADKSVKLWDLAQTKCLRSFSHHSNKVQTIAWNPAETTALLSGSFDKTVKVFVFFFFFLRAALDDFAPHVANGCSIPRGRLVVVCIFRRRDRQMESVCAPVFPCTFG